MSEFLQQPTLTFDENDRSNMSLPPPISIKGHQRSRTTVELPPLFNRTPSVSPTRSSTFLPFRRTSRAESPERPTSLSKVLESEADQQTRTKMSAVDKLTSWFEGSSEPVNITLVPSQKKDRDEPFYQINDTESRGTDSRDNLTQRPILKSMGSSTSANSSRFSFFKKAAPVQPKTNPDDLLHMDIREALQVDTVEDITPESYYALQQNAEALLKKFQLSYAENVGALRQITSAKNIQSDELDAAQMRNEHLKMQLTEMAERAAEQERVMASMREELDKHQQSIRMISENEPEISRRYRRGRMSDVSSAGESLSDSDVSCGMSVFSEADSVQTSGSSISPSPVMKHVRLHSPMFKQGITAHSNSHTTPAYVAECPNCHGIPASEAWDVIGMMKMESVGLKQRVADLELAQDAALDLLNGLNL